MGNTDKAWQRFGQTDPDYAILSHPRFRAAAKEGEARRNLTLLKSDDGLENLSGDFDFFHSVIVFQHIAARRGEMILRTMLRRLSSNGIGAIHFLYAISVPWWKRLARKLRATFPFVNDLANLVKGPSLQISIYGDEQLQRQPAAPPSARASVTSCSSPVLRSWPIQRHSFVL